MIAENKIESVIFYVIRGFAIFSVAYAHSLNLSDLNLSRIGALLGIIGVPLFLISSGYYFRQTKIDISYLKKKFKTLISPWLIWGTVAYILTVMSSQVKCSFLDYILFLSGYYTWLYYVPIFILILFLFNIIKINDKSIFFLILFSLISNIITDNFLIQLYITPYQNPLNWIIFFAIGVLLKRKNYLSQFVCRGPLFIFLLLSLALFILFFVEKIRYWNLFCIIFELISFVFIYIISSRYRSSLNFIEILGKKSYILYFLHMQVGIYFANRLIDILYLSNEVILLLFKPYIVILITLSIVYSLEIVLKMLKMSEFNVYLGLR